MRVNLGEFFHLLTWQAAYAMADMSLVLANDAHLAVAKQLIVVEQGTRYGVLNCHDANTGGVILHVRKDLLKG
jgi:hypothetical protein